MARPSTRATRFWKRLAQNYGAKLAEEYGPHPPEDWCAVIDRADDERLQKALVTIRAQHPNWPPTLGQFEATIPKRDMHRSDSTVDRLAVHAAGLPGLCEHQRMFRWNYFGRVDWPAVEIRGVVIPDCEDCGKPDRRVLVTDLVEQVAC